MQLRGVGTVRRRETAFEESCDRHRFDRRPAGRAGRGTGDSRGARALDPGRADLPRWRGHHPHGSVPPASRRGGGVHLSRPSHPRVPEGVPGRGAGGVGRALDPHVARAQQYLRRGAGGRRKRRRGADGRVQLQYGRHRPGVCRPGGSPHRSDRCPTGGGRSPGGGDGGQDPVSIHPRHL
jgi:hypothetical protein